MNSHPDAVRSGTKRWSSSAFGRLEATIKAQLSALAILMAAIAWPAERATAGSSASLRVTGNGDALLAYDCVFADGSRVAGRVTPPWSHTWSTRGVRCRFEQIGAGSGIVIDLRSHGSRLRVTISGRGGSAMLGVGRQ